MKKKLLQILLVILTLTCIVAFSACSCSGDDIAVEGDGKVKFESVYFKQDVVNMSVGEEYQSVISVDGASGWKVEDTSIATISSSGLVTAQKEGTTLVSVNVGEQEYSYLLLVKAKENFFSLKLDKSNLSMATDSTVTINTIIYAAGVGDYTVNWSIQNPAVADIVSYDNTKCVIKSKTQGQAVLTATCGKVESVCYITVANVDAYSGQTSVNAISSVADVKPSINGSYSQIYENNSNLIWIAHENRFNKIVPAVGDFAVKDKEVSYQIPYTFNASAGYFTSGFGFNLTVDKEDLLVYKKYSGLDILRIDVVFKNLVGQGTSASQTRYIDVLSGFESGVAQYTRYGINNYTWHTFTFDLDMIIDNYETLKDTAFGSGYVMFAMTNDKNLNNLSANGGKYDNVTASADCPTSVSAGNLGADYYVYFGKIAFENSENLAAEKEAEIAAVYAGKTSVNAVSGVAGIAPSLGNGEKHVYYNNSNFLTLEGYVVVSEPTDVTVKDKEVSYQIAFSNLGNLNWTHPGVGFNLSLSKQDLINYKTHSGLTSLSVEIMIDIARYDGQSHTRYVDVLTGYDASGVGQYTRYDIKDTAWHTFTFDIDFIINNYDAFTNLTYDNNRTDEVEAGSGYVLFSFPTASATTSIPDTVDGTNCSTSVGGGQFGTEYVIYFGQIAFVK